MGAAPLSLTRQRVERERESSQGPGGLSFSSLIMTVWQAGKQEVGDGEMERKREEWEIDDRRQREVREGGVGERESK